MHDDDDDYYYFIVFEDSSVVGSDACHRKTARVPAGRVYLYVSVVHNIINIMFDSRAIRRGPRRSSAAAYNII